MTDSQPKNGPRFVLAAAARIGCFEDGKWPDNLTLEQVARLLAGGGLYKRSGEQKEYYRILKGMLYSDSNCGKLEFSEVPQGSVAVSTGISLENSPRFRTDYAAEKTPITPIRYISRKQLEDWLCNTGQKPGEYITEWLQVGGVVYGESETTLSQQTELTAAPTVEQNILKKSIVESRIDKIIEILSAAGHEVMAVPYGEKNATRTKCLSEFSNKPLLFTDSTFEQAWSQGSKEKRLCLLDKDKFTSRKR